LNHAEHVWGLQGKAHKVLCAPRFYGRTAFEILIRVKDAARRTVIDVRPDVTRSGTGGCFSFSSVRTLAVAARKLSGESVDEPPDRRMDAGG